MKYQPNYKDPRVINRIRHAYGFSRGCMSIDKPSSWSKSYIDKYFGTQNHNLSKFLRNHLLICINHNYNKEQGITKQYKLNPRGVEYIRSILTGNDQQFIQWAKTNNYKDEITHTNTSPCVAHLYDEYIVSKFCEREYGVELKSLEFTYQDKASRLWHPLQNVKREHKKRIMAEAGLSYQYDIDACAPTLLLQHAQHLGMDEYLFAINEYLKNKDEIRNQLAKEIEVDPQTIKVIINALFCGARLGTSPEFAISHLLKNDKAKIIYLKENEFITQLRKDIKVIWDTIETSLPVIKKQMPNGKERKLPLNSKRRWAVYFQLERQVLNQVRTYLINTNNKHFLEHDGWNASQEINQQELISFIEKSIGFSIKIKMDKIKEEKTSHNTSPCVAQVRNTNIFIVKKLDTNQEIRKRPELYHSSDQENNK